jgi:hypothetical protein
MTMTTGNARLPDDAAGWDQAGPGLLIADGLIGLDFEVRDLAEERAHVLRVTDAGGAFCQLTISATVLLTRGPYSVRERSLDGSGHGACCRST